MVACGLMKSVGAMPLFQARHVARSKARDASLVSLWLKLPNYGSNVNSEQKNFGRRIEILISHCAQSASAFEMTVMKLVYAFVNEALGESEKKKSAK
jgi:hypothetical protein